MFYTYILYSPTKDEYFISATTVKAKEALQDAVQTPELLEKAKDWNLIYQETLETLEKAEKRARFIESKNSRMFIERLVNCKM